MNDLAVRIMTAPKAALFFLGQAGFVIKSGKGTLLGADMYLSDCVERIEGNDGYKRLMPKLLSPSEIVFDHIITTHPHYDHFDADAVPVLMSGGHTRLYASYNCEAEVKRLLMTDGDLSRRIRYVKEGDSAQMDDICVHFVPCDHGKDAPDAFGAVIETDGKRIYIAGDTCLRLDRAEEIKSLGCIDIMIAPINGAFGNMNEHDFVKLCAELSPKTAIPCHFGMFASHGGDPGLFIEEIRKELPYQKYLLMTQGECLYL